MFLELGVYIEHEFTGKYAETTDKKKIDGFENLTHFQGLKDFDLLSVAARVLRAEFLLE